MFYALVNTANAILRRQFFDAPPSDLAPEKGLRWLPVVEIGADVTSDPLTQILDADESVAADRVTRRWIVRAKTPDECLADCRAARREAYPPLHEQIEALTENTTGRPEKLAKILDRIAAVKAAFPKPAPPPG